MSAGETAIRTAAKWGTILVGGVLLVRWLGGQALEVVEAAHPLGPNSAINDVEKALVGENYLPLSFLEVLFPATLLNRLIDDKPGIVARSEDGDP